MKVRVDSTAQELIDNPPTVNECVFRVGQTAAQALSLGAIKEERFIELLEEVPAKLTERVEQFPSQLMENATTFANEAPTKVLDMVNTIPKRLEDKYEQVKTRVETGKWPKNEIAAPVGNSQTTATDPVPAATVTEIQPAMTLAEQTAALNDRLTKLRAFERGLKLEGDVLSSVRAEKKRIKAQLRS
jgi:hypothetical protein